MTTSRIDWVTGLAGIIVILIALGHAIFDSVSAQIPPQKPPDAKQLPTGTPPPESLEGLKLANTQLRNVIQQQQAVISTLQKQLAEAQTGAVDRPPKTEAEPAAPPNVALEKLTPAFFATQFRGIRDAAQQPCRDLGGKFSITVTQAPIGRPAVNAVCAW